ncbi:MAG: extracellular solute-binding protein [bacterium]|nr:extracellular solute-binding protein [bacterium]
MKRFVCVLIVMMFGLMPVLNVAAEEKVVITVFDGQKLRLDVHRALESIIEAKLPNVDFQIVEGPPTGPQHNTKLITELRGGVGSDIFRVGEVQAEIVASGFAVDITDRVEAWSDWAQFYEPAKEAMLQVGNGRIYSLPFTGSSMAIWYRKDLLQEAGIPEKQPQTWNELLDIARKVVANSRAKYGLMLPMGSIWGHGPYNEGFKHMLLGSSTPFIQAEDGRIIASSQGLLETFTFYETLVKEELFQTDAMLAPTPHVIPKYQQFPAGILAMETQGTWGWRNDYGPEGATPIENITEKVGTWGFPSRDGSQPPYIVGDFAHVFMINANSKHPDLAWEVLKILTSAEAAGRFSLNVGGIAARKDARDAFPEYANHPELLADEDRLSELKNIPTFEGENAVLQAVATATEHLLLGRTAEEALEVYKNNILQANRRDMEGRTVILPLEE